MAAALTNYALLDCDKYGGEDASPARVAFFVAMFFLDGDTMTVKRPLRYFGSCYISPQLEQWCHEALAQFQDDTPCLPTFSYDLSDTAVYVPRAGDVLIGDDGRIDASKNPLRWSVAASRVDVMFPDARPTRLRFGFLSEALRWRFSRIS